MTVKIGNKLWELPEGDKHPLPVDFELVRLLGPGDWSLQDIHEVGKMIDRKPVIKEAVLELINIIKAQQ